MSAAAAIDTSKLSDAAKACVVKMTNAKVDASCIRTFLAQHNIISSGQTGVIPDSAIKPVKDLPALESLSTSCPQYLVEQTVMLKLNGGLGTGMGLNDAKSLLPVKDGKNFLDFTAQQVEYLRKTQGSKNLRFMLMNSFSTEKSTRAFLKKYPDIHSHFDSQVHLMQNQVPKIKQDNFFPAEWPAHPAHEWAPPGHGDLYTALYGSGKLQELLKGGYRYMFVSNGDNLGATLDNRLLAYMEANSIDFLMEVCRRTESDKKGGHLAEEEDANGHTRLLLRESAQCPPEDAQNFQDINKYAFFNTNNLWVDLLALHRIMEKHDGTLPLTVIRNAKTVDPTDPKSTAVYQLETAMGAAISLFDNSSAVVVPRERFSPVKTCADLLSLRSDAYLTTDDCRLVLNPRCGSTPPVVDLDAKHYKLIKGFDALVANGVPSMIECRRLTVRGPVVFGKGVVLKGDISIDNSKSETPYVVADGEVLSNATITV